MASVKCELSAPESLNLANANKEETSSGTSDEKSDKRSGTDSTPETPQDENFKCHGHADKSLKRMEDFLHAQQLTDVTLLAGSERISAHRLVLSACSEYFAAMFGGGLRESTQAEIELQDVDPGCLAELVNYCYSGRIDLREDTVEVMLATSSLLQIPEVTEACSIFLEKRLHPSNCIGISLFADAQSCQCLLKKARRYTADHFMDVVDSQEFLQLGPEQVGSLLACDDLNVPSEQDILTALVCWIKHAPESRQAHVGELLAHVKLPLLSPSFITDHVEAEPLFANNTQCRELIMEAMKYHLLPERRATLASPRTCPRKSTVGNMYAVGGIDASKGANSLERYDPRANKWSTLANLPSRRLQFGVALLDDKIIVVGGRDGLKTLNVVESFDTVTCAWNSLPGMSTSRHGLGVGVLGGPLYAVGGHDGWSYLNTVERWDPQARQWSYVAPMSTQRSTVGVAVLNDRLYAVGGRDGSVCLRTVECYDPYTNRWLPCAPMTKQRGGVGLAALDGCLYACGGHDAPASHPSAARLCCCERYDPKTDTWTAVAPMSVGRDGIGVGVLGDRLMAVGGYDGNQYLDLVESYDPATNEWTQVASMNLRRASTCVVIL